MQLLLRCHCLRHVLRCLQNRMFRLIHQPYITMCTADPPVTILASMPLTNPPKPPLASVRKPTQPYITTCTAVIPVTIIALR